MRMKSRWAASVLALVLVIALLVGVLPAGAAAAQKKQYEHYLCLGDSIAAGYTQEATYAYYMQVNPNAYHSLVAEALGAELMQLGWSGTRTEELRYLFDPDFEGDDWVMSITSMDKLEHYTGDSETWNAVLDGSTIKNYQDYYGENFLRDIYNDALKNADLVTLNVGTNDILTFPFMRARSLLYAAMSGEGSDNAVSRYLGMVEQFIGEENFPAALSALMQAANMLGMVPEIVQVIAESMVHGYQRFFANWRPLIDQMNKLNPNMTLVVINLYNPLAKVKLTDSDMTRIGQLGELLIASLNRTIANYAEEGGYLIADVTGTEVWDSRAAVVDVMNFAATVITDVHPTNEGHAYMTQKILEALADEETGEFPFTDVAEQDWFYDDVYYVWETGLMNGMEPTHFAPEGVTTRAQFATVLYRMAGAPDVEGVQCPFTDLAADWYRDAVTWAYGAGVVTGVTATTFDPDAPVTREQLVTMLYRYSGADANAGALAQFSDAAAVSNYARPAVTWAVDAGLLRGMDDGTLRPQGTATRAQLAAFLHRYDTTVS